jgi:hypothetical protein
MKIMNRTLKRTILLAFSFALVMVIPVTSEGVGVKVGDWVKYSDFSFTWNMPEEAEDPSGFASISEIDWVKVEVLNVDGTNVTVKFTTHYKNGTEDSETNSGDVKTGPEDLPFIIEANLNSGDKIPWEFVPGWELYINGTTSRTYAGASRSVNYVNLTRTAGDSVMTLKLYWDKAKGILCDMLISASISYEGTVYSMSMSMKITETNMWSGAGFLPTVLTENWLWVIIVVAVVTICIVVFVVSKLASRSAPPLPPLS